MTDITLPKGLTIDLSNGDSNSMLITISKSQLEQLTAERDKYRDACERLIGHYYGGDGYFHNVGEPKFIEIDEFGDKYNFARQVEAEIKGESK